MIGSIISAGLNFLSNRSANKANQAAFNAQMAQQERFAKEGIRWKVADAKAAGIHPLYALGAQTHSFAPQSLQNTATDFSALGQGINRALDSTRTSQERLGAVQLSLAEAQAEGAKLDNDIKRTQLASALSQPRNPPFPTVNGTSVSGNEPSVQGPTIKQETRRDVADPEKDWQVYGSGPSVGFMKTPTGGFVPVIPPELAESLESDFVGRWDWQMRNRLLPLLGYRNPPNLGQKADEVVVWDPGMQEWVIRKMSGYLKHHRGVPRR